MSGNDAQTRVAIMAASEQDHSRLSTLLSDAGLNVVLQEVAGENFIRQLEQTSADVLLVDLSDDAGSEVDIIDTLLEYDSLPVFFNDGSKAGIETNALWAKKLARRLEQLARDFEPEPLQENESGLALESVDEGLTTAEKSSEYSLELEPVFEQEADPETVQESVNDSELEIAANPDGLSMSEQATEFDLALEPEPQPELSLDEGPEPIEDSGNDDELALAAEFEDLITDEPVNDGGLELETELTLEPETTLLEEKDTELETMPDFEEKVSEEPTTDFSLDTETFSNIEDEISDEIESLPQQADSAMVALKEDSSVSDLPEGAANNVWVLGASLGGPQAVRQFLMAIKKDLPVAFVLAQHIGENHISLLAEQLDRVTKFKVFPGYNGHMIRHYEVILAPAGKNIHITDDGYISLSDQEENAIYSPCINDVMMAVAERYGNMAGTIVFSGMGDDGAIGCQSVAENGGIVWAQDVDSCVISSMPDQARKTNNVTFSANPRRLADELYKYYME